MSTRKSLVHNFVPFTDRIDAILNKGPTESYGAYIHKFNFLNIARNNNVLPVYVHRDRGHPKVDLVLKHVKSKLNSRNKFEVNRLFNRCLVENDNEFNNISITLTHKPAYNALEIERLVSIYKNRKNKIKIPTKKPLTLKNSIKQSNSQRTVQQPKYGAIKTSANRFLSQRLPTIQSNIPYSHTSPNLGPLGPSERVANIRRSSSILPRINATDPNLLNFTYSELNQIEDMSNLNLENSRRDHYYSLLDHTEIDEVDPICLPTEVKVKDSLLTSKKRRVFNKVELENRINLENNGVNNELNEFYGRTYDKCIYDTICSNHAKNCGKIKAKGLLVLRLPATTVLELKISSNFDPTKKCTETYTIINNFLIKYLKLGGYRRPTFNNLHLAGNEVVIDLECKFNEQAIEMIKTRKKFNGKAGLNWAFPGSKDFRVMLNNMLKKKLCKKWYLSVTGCRIMLVLEDSNTRDKLYYHTVKCSLELAGILASCKNTKDVLKLVKSKNVVYALNSIFSYSSNLIKPVDNTTLSQTLEVECGEQE